MGLPLYNPPVQSDIAPSKSISYERRAAQTRSRIRRTNALEANRERERTSGNELIRQRIRNLAQQTRELRRQPSLRSLPLPQGSVELALVHHDSGELDAARAVSEDLLRLQQYISNPLASIVSSRIDIAASVPSDRPDEAPLHAISLTREMTRSERVDAVAAFAMQPFVERNPGVLERIAMTLELYCSWIRTDEELEHFREDFQRGVDSALFHFSNREEFHRSARRRRVLHRMMREEDAASSGLDGLGDRNRSLSPEGYDVWDTLLYTVTPDPQPPSAGSSFTSASASVVAASQSAVPESSATSFTDPNPDTAGELTWQELGCESENDDAEEEGMPALAPAAPDAPVDVTRATNARSQARARRALTSDRHERVNDAFRQLVHYLRTPEEPISPPQGLLDGMDAASRRDFANLLQQQARSNAP